MKTFYQLLANNMIAGTTTNFLWFVITYWVYLETKSVFATALVSGIYLVTATVCGFWFGSIVDHTKKKQAMMISSLASLFFFIIGYLIYLSAPDGTFSDIKSAYLWTFILVAMFGVTAGNIRNIALPTAVTILVPEPDRDKANGLNGTVFGLSFLITSTASGLALGYAGMSWSIAATIILTLVAIAHLFFLNIPEKEIVHVEDGQGKIDIKGTIKVVSGISGLFGLLFFNTFNNFLGGVFMALMDAYGLTLVSVQVWGLIWGFLSIAFIVGGAYIAKKGLGPTPLKVLFLTNIAMWTVSIFFTVQPSIYLMAAGMFIYLSLIPFIEAAEQTIIQKVVPQERQGRVFGFAHSIESAASPITAFLIGPLTQFIFIPFMTDGWGAQTIGSWFGTGTGRGIALVFTLTGIVGLIVTIFAMRSKSYKQLAAQYQNA